MKRIVAFLEHIDTWLERYFGKKWHWAITIPVFAVLVFALYFAFCFTNVPYQDSGFRDQGSAIAASVLGGTLIVVMLAYFVLEIITKRLTGRKTAWVFLVIASTLLTLWGFQHALNLHHHHDSGALSSGNHWTIIYDIYSTGEIPPVNLHNQYYQPKFFHVIIAGLMKFNGLFIHLGDQALSASYPAYTISAYHQLELTRVFMVYLGIVCLYAIYRIYQGLGLSDKKVGLATAITVMIPEFWFIQFFFNNDGLACTLSFVALALALAFKRNEKWLPLVFCAIALGLSMMAKLNGALMAFPIAFIFLYVLIKKLRNSEKNRKDILVLLGKFALFAVIVFPLGLWTPILYKIKYDMPIGYVWDITPTLEDKQRYGMYIDPTFYNFFERCFPFPARDLFQSPFNYRWRHKVDGVYINEYGVIDYNCWTAFFKTAFFDEWDDFFAQQGYLPGALLVVGMYLEVLLAYLSFVGLVVYAVLYFKNKQWKQNVFLPGVLLVAAVAVAVNYIYFVNRYPVGCSQNARYVMPLFIPLQALIASLCCDIHDKISLARSKCVSPSGE